jgi:recombination protein RecA
VVAESSKANKKRISTGLPLRSIRRTFRGLMASSPAVAASHSSFPAFSPGNAKQAVLEHLAETPRLARVTAASHLEIRPAPATVSFGIAALNTLTGGLPRGCLTEIVGPDSSGRTSVLLAALAAATQRGEICALIDATDSFHPHSAAAAGIDLCRLLWVRCTAPPSSPDSPASSPGIKPRTDPKIIHARRDTSSSHTPKASFSGLTRPPCPFRQLRESRDGYVTASTYRGAPEPSGLRNLFQSSPAHTASSKNLHKASVQTAIFSTAEESYSDISHESVFSQQDTRAKRLKMEGPAERALRATDLLLQSGGFGMVAIDLAGIPVKTARRVPLTTWFRFRRVIESTPTVLLLVGEQPCAQTCASLGLRMSGQEASSVPQSNASSVVSRRPLAESYQFSAVSCPLSASSQLFASSNSSFTRATSAPEFAAQSSKSEISLTHARLLEGLHLRIELLRARSERKPMQSVIGFQAKAAWTG